MQAAEGMGKEQRLRVSAAGRPIDSNPATVYHRLNSVA